MNQAVETEPVQGTLVSLDIDTAPVAAELKPDVDTGVLLKAYAESFEIVDEATANSFAAWRNELDAREKAIVAKLAPAKKAAHEAHARICSLESEALLPLRTAKQIANRKIGWWHSEQERIERERYEAERAAARKAEEDARLATAAALEKEGEHESAAAVLDEPIVTAAVVPARKPVVSGVTFRETFKAEVMNKLALVQAIAKAPMLLHLVDVNQAALNGLARAQKEMLQIPGVRVVRDKGVATGRR